ncbi:MAG: F0F1 ATP synthase subunit alpha [Chloroflexi bacterium]|nr:F0F1 ATP synthase subunit alpha [Chloroflexota bacterium]MCL5947136.1 F0F1 ATP synthase subunit alpha [Chloroflexota bacterium]
MALSAEDITSIIKQQIAGAKLPVIERSVGTIVQVGDGIAQVFGLSGAMASELLEFPHGVYGLALNLQEDTVSVIILGDDSELREGEEVHTTGRLVEVPVGEALIGRVVNPLGQPVDGKGPIETTETSPIDKVAPGVITRKSVTVPLQTGIKAIDSMTPIGRGQRELIIGDRQTGKTAIAIDTIINQKGTGVICIYVAIGQKTSKVAEIVATLERFGAMEHTIVVAANASEPASMQYIAPYSGCSMGEYFRDHGRDALIVYDDLSKHAAAYRQVSLLLRRPPGREAFPGDVFYLHSRLLERAACLNEQYGGGTLTALPIIETQLGDVSAYIPTNVISITDGQIYLESDLFYQGQRPAVNVGLSVSRVGGKAQIRAMRTVAGTLRLDLAAFRDLAAFAQFGSDLDAATRARIEQGQRMTYILRQPQYQPVTVEHQVVILYAGIRGHLSDIPLAKVPEWETGFHEYLNAQHGDLLGAIRDQQALTPELEEKLKQAIADYKKIA